MYKVIIIHGAYGSPKENWIPWLTSKLKMNSFDVVVPTFPTPEKQSLINWLDVINPYMEEINNDTILLGHSIGATFILSLLELLCRPARQAILVSGFVNDLGNQDFDRINKSFYAKSFDWAKIKSMAEQFIVIQGDNDPYVPSSEAKTLAHNLGVKPTLIHNGGHLNSDAGFEEFPQLLTQILNAKED